MGYIKYYFQCEEAARESLIGLLSSLPFEAFQEVDAGVEAYLPDQDAPEDLEADLAGFQAVISFSYTLEEVPDRNWNEVWESNFEPVRIGDFCGVRAGFHPPFDPPVQYEIRIDPRMAFGTGHHATTWSMISLMQSLDLQEKSVLDYGCGTGILAILAGQLGGVPIDAVDIEEAAYENTCENVELNDVFGIRCFHGTLNAVPTRTYDLILANINRNVILQTLTEMVERLRPGGHLLMSGFLSEDQPRLREACTAAGLQESKSVEKDRWIAMHWIRPQTD